MRIRWNGRPSGRLVMALPAAVRITSAGPRPIAASAARAPSASPAIASAPVNTGTAPRSQHSPSSSRTSAARSGLLAAISSPRSATTIAWPSARRCAPRRCAGRCRAARAPAPRSRRRRSGQARGPGGLVDDAGRQPGRIVRDHGGQLVERRRQPRVAQRPAGQARVRADQAGVVDRDEAGVDQRRPRVAHGGARLGRRPAPA
jgi:hypothetical protein